MKLMGPPVRRFFIRPLTWTALPGVALTALLIAAPAVAQSDYHEEIESWRSNRVDGLTGEDGWLTLVGLFWLEEGESSIGSDEASTIRLPEDKAPDRVGSIWLRDGKAVLEVDPEVPVLHEGAQVESLELADDSEGAPTLFRLGDLSAYLIRRGDEVALRVKDRNHPARAAFTEIETYPTDQSWRVEGRFEHYQPTRAIPIPTVLGTIDTQPSSGAVVFEVEGEPYRLDVLAKPGDEEMFIIFADTTSGKETYGGGRYLYAKAPDEEGRVVVDFNKAYNPPCVFTPYATCPLPPRQNRLPIAVEAGEKVYDKK
jgi:uncharacterized protein (DUF1684 family)